MRVASVLVPSGPMKGAASEGPRATNMADSAFMNCLFYTSSGERRTCGHRAYGMSCRRNGGVDIAMQFR